MVKVAIIGARRRRQGIGEYVARWFSAAGARVCSVFGTTPETANSAQETLKRRYNIETEACTSLEAAIENHSPDIVAVCSPYDVHYEQLQVILEAGIHCLCEKPMWWGEADDRLAATAQLVDGFIKKNRYLSLITQWPNTLTSYYEIYPQLKGQPIESFDMQLCPATKGYEMILDAAPHLLSMLQYLVGYGAVRSVQRRWLDPNQRELVVGFDYRHREGDTQVTFRLSTCESAPRPASYAINTFPVRRIIEPLDYQMYLVGGGRTVAIEDPLKIEIKNFLYKVETNAAIDKRALIEGIGALEILYTGAEELHRNT